VPPPIDILIRKFKLSKHNYRVFEWGSSEGSAFQLSILNVYAVVVLSIFFSRYHRKEKLVLWIGSWVCNLEPELNRVLSRPLLESRCVKTDIAACCAELRCYVLIIASYAVKYLLRVGKGAVHVSTFWRQFKVDIFELFATLKLHGAPHLAFVRKRISFHVFFCELHVNKSTGVISQIYGVQWVQSLSRICEIEMLYVAVKGSE